MSVLQGTEALERATRRRRQWSEEEKQRLVAQTRETGSSVASVARQHGVNANLLFNWRRQVEGATAGTGGETVGFVPAIVSPDPPALAIADNRIEITLPGGARIVVGAAVDGEPMHKQSPQLAQHVRRNVPWALRRKRAGEAIFPALLGNQTEGIEVDVRVFIANRPSEELMGPELRSSACCGTCPCARFRAESAR